MSLLCSHSCPAFIFKNIRLPLCVYRMKMRAVVMVWKFFARLLRVSIRVIEDPRFRIGSFISEVAPAMLPDIRIVGPTSASILVPWRRLAFISETHARPLQSFQVSLKARVGATLIRTIL